MNAPLKLKKCKYCKTEFMPHPLRPMQAVCGPKCAAYWMQKEKKKFEAKLKKEERQELRIQREKLKGVRDHIREAQPIFNLFIRLRDKDAPCISCGRLEVEWTAGGAWDCGHFLSVGSHPELRFEEDNAHKQCKKCNGGAGKFSKKNHTVSAQYEINLIKKIGLERVEWLKGPHEPKHYTIEDAIAIKALYRSKIKALKGAAT